MGTPSPLETLSSSSAAAAAAEEYRTVWSAPPKKPAGRTKFRETRHPVYRGVRRRGAGARGRWVCEVRVPGRRGARLWLGTFAAPETAARAHDAAALALSGRAACLNFADSAWLLPPLMPALAAAAAAGAREVRGAVAAAVEAFRRRSAAASALSPSSQAEETADDKDDVRSPGAAALTPDVFELDHDVFRFGGMDAGSYYASLAQGLLVEPPAAGAWCEDGENGGAAAEMALWSF
ncbi:hypothetical protein ACP4OV_024189 [Aristida adscensionis]